MATNLRRLGIPILTPLRALQRLRSWKGQIFTPVVHPKAETFLISISIGAARAICAKAARDSLGIAWVTPRNDAHRLSRVEICIVDPADEPEDGGNGKV